MFRPSPDTSALIDFNKQGFGLIAESVWTQPRHSPSPHHSVPQCQDPFTFALRRNSLEPLLRTQCQPGSSVTESSLPERLRQLDLGR